ncbi:O-methyltransferase [Mucisphaera sp.]|uniref:O-methyltransferase n=1 Tax=Mucisphaera sp. TaxID=2913024 RepID=UPI003D10C07A
MHPRSRRLHRAHHPPQGHENTFDLAYIDADKIAYPAYYELTHKLLRPGKIIALDNMLRSGHVADPQNSEPSIMAIRELNCTIATDPRVDASFLPMYDGLLLARKRSEIEPNSA